MITLTAGPHVEALNRRLPRPVTAPLKALIKGYRRLTAGYRTLPDFLVIGARKCGTTSLYEYLTDHPCILPALSKEIFYFNHAYARGERWYRQHFPLERERRYWSRRRGCPVLTGEATPSYFNDPVVPDRVRRMNPAIKLVVMFRDPVAAVYSAYQFGIKRGNYTSAGHPFRGLVESELGRLEADPVATDDGALLLPRYAYATHLRRWYDVFPREQILLMCLEWFAAAPQAQFNRLTDFLGLPRSADQSFAPHNVNRYPALEPEVQDRLRAFYRPHNRRLAGMTGLAYPWPGGEPVTAADPTWVTSDSGEFAAA
jgi:hypothetical protein